MATGADGTVKVKLSPESYANLLSAERALHDYLPEFDKAEECGIECNYLRDSAQQMLQRIAKMKEHYRPT